MLNATESPTTRTSAVRPGRSGAPRGVTGGAGGSGASAATSAVGVRPLERRSGLRQLGASHGSRAPLIPISVKPDAVGGPSLRIELTSRPGGHLAPPGRGRRLRRRLPPRTRSWFQRSIRAGSFSACPGGGTPSALRPGLRRSSDARVGSAGRTGGDRGAVPARCWPCAVRSRPARRHRSAASAVDQFPDLGGQEVVQSGRARVPPRGLGVQPTVGDVARAATRPPPRRVAVAATEAIQGPSPHRNDRCHVRRAPSLRRTNPPSATPQFGRGGDRDLQRAASLGARVVAQQLPGLRPARRRPPSTRTGAGGTVVVVVAALAAAASSDGPGGRR